MSDEGLQDRIETSARRARKKARRASMAAEKLSVPKFSPGVVGMARGLVLAILTAIISALTIAVQGGHVGKATLVAVVTSVGVAVLRFIEGVLDGKAGAPASTRLLGGPPKAS